MVSRTSCWGSLTGRRRSKTWSRRVKMAVFAPMPRARVRTATAVKPGVRTSMRKVYFKSRRAVSSQPMMVRWRVASLAVLVTGTPGQLEVKTKKATKSLMKVRKDSWTETENKRRTLFSRPWHDPTSGRNLVGAGRGYPMNVQAFDLLLKKNGDPVDDFIQGSTRTESGEGMELIDARHTAHHVLEARFIGLVVGHVLNGRGTASALLHSLCQSLDGDFLGV